MYLLNFFCGFSLKTANIFIVIFPLYVIVEIVLFFGVRFNNDKYPYNRLSIFVSIYLSILG